MLVLLGICSRASGTSPHLNSHHRSPHGPFVKRLGTVSHSSSSGPAFGEGAVELLKARSWLQKASGLYLFTRNRHRHQSASRVWTSASEFHLICSVRVDIIIRPRICFYRTPDHILRAETHNYCASSRPWHRTRTPSSHFPSSTRSSSSTSSQSPPWSAPITHTFSRKPTWT